MRDDRVYLSHIDEAIGRILDYTAGGREEFMQSNLLQDAVVRNFEIIGEATKNLTSATRAQRADIPWRRIAGLRDVLIHDYMGVDPAEVWRVVELHLPELRGAVNDLLSR
ncbi:MAG: DUF86 domain-containing protein [Candidatus Brocadiia bacterium]